MARNSFYFSLKIPTFYTSNFPPSHRLAGAGHIDKPPAHGGAHTRTLPPHTSSQQQQRPRIPPRDRVRQKLAEKQQALQQQRKPSPPPASDSLERRRGVERLGAHVLDKLAYLIGEIESTLEHVRSESASGRRAANASGMRVAREQLIGEARRFVSTSKTFVKSATGLVYGGADDALPPTSRRPARLDTRHDTPSTADAAQFCDSLERCQDLLTMMFYSGHMVARHAPLSSDAVALVEGVMLVAVTFRSTVQVCLADRFGLQGLNYFGRARIGRK